MHEVCHLNHISFRDRIDSVSPVRLAAALMIAYWHKDNDDVLHWMKWELSNIVVEFYSYGVGSYFDLEKFGTLTEKFLNDLKFVTVVMSHDRQ